MQRYSLETMTPRHWEQLRSGIETLLMHGELYDDHRAGKSTKQLDWMIRFTPPFIRFFERTRTDHPERLVAWGNLVGNVGLTRSDVSDLVDAWRAYQSEQSAASSAASCP